VNVYKAAIPTLDIFYTLEGVEFLPVNKNIYLQIQCYINNNEQIYKEYIRHTMFLFNGNIVWSGLEQEDMKPMYLFLKRTLKNLSPDRRGIIYGPKSLEKNCTEFECPQVYIDTNVYYLVVYKHGECFMVFLVTESAYKNIQFYINLDLTLNEQLSFLQKCISKELKNSPPEEFFFYLFQSHESCIKIFFWIERASSRIP